MQRSFFRDNVPKILISVVFLPKLWYNFCHAICKEKHNLKEPLLWLDETIKSYEKNFPS